VTTLRYGTPKEAGMSPARIENLRRLGAKWVEEGTHPALVLLVARRGVIVLHEAWGKQGPEGDAPRLSTDAIFPLASLSKVFAATCAMLLVEDGLLGLNRPVQEYIPEFSGPGKEDVLVHHLLTHTSGIYEDEVWAQFKADVAGWTEGVGTVRRPRETTQHPLMGRLLGGIYEAPLHHDPGVEMSYSPYAGYSLLAEVVRRVSGQSLVEFSQERLFDHAGMTDTSFVIAEAASDWLVRRTSAGPLDDVVEGVVDRRVPVGAGSATSTTLDMAKFGQMFLDGGKSAAKQVLSIATVREMTRNQIPGISALYGGYRAKEASWGFGWAIKGVEKWPQSASLLSPQTFWHSGGTGTGLWVDPVNELICVYFSVLLGMRNRFDRDWKADLFANAAVAAIED
jgi:CubicO group peptidase (beta-lactamase class C family)